MRLPVERLDLAIRGMPKTPREAAGSVGGIGAPELDMVKKLYLEPIGFWVGSDKVLKPNIKA